VSVATKPERSQVAPARLVAGEPPPTPADAAPEPLSDAWAGDRIAMAVWLCGALLMTVLLMKDLIYGILFR
jgi:hypothetical protein